MGQSGLSSISTDLQKMLLDVAFRHLTEDGAPKGGRRRSSQELEVEVGFFVRVGGRTSGGRIPWATSIISFSAFLRMGELEPSGPWHTVFPLLILQMREISSTIVRTVKDSLP